MGAACRERIYNVTSQRAKAVSTCIYLKGVARGCVLISVIVRISKLTFHLRSEKMDAVPGEGNWSAGRNFGKKILHVIQSMSLKGLAEADTSTGCTAHSRMISKA
jgi:hypothetical protein